jgi:hypothetical protein
MEMQIKEFVHARLARITKCEEHTKFVMPKASEIGKFIEISGTVIRTGDPTFYILLTIRLHKKHRMVSKIRMSHLQRPIHN